MAGPRKVFRIEQTAFAGAADGAAAALQAEIVRAVGTLSAAAVRPAASAERPRMACALDAVSRDAAQATQQILAAAERIDQLAGMIATSRDDADGRHSAQAISALVISIFEACNFQDLIGQRIAEVRSALDAAAADGAARHAIKLRQHLHGPRLDNDGGHVSQGEIDAMFEG